jgi:glycine/D-amino acid oxidase-like deaminating enzyme
LQSIISVGAGIVGASTAIHLTQLGAEIHLIDSNAPERATFDLSQHKNSLL